MGLIIVLFFGCGACHRADRAAVPSTKAVDSAAAAAPDTIKALPVDSVEREGSEGRLDSDEMKVR